MSEHEELNRTIDRLRDQLAAAEQQLTTATAMLGECESVLARLPQYPGVHAVLTRIRTATKGAKQ